MLVLCACACGTADDPDQPPTAALLVPDYVDLGQRASLDASGSRDPEGSIVGFRFTIADGSAAVTQPGPLFDHTFQLAGLIGVSVEVIDAGGNVARATASVAVRRP